MNSSDFGFILFRWSVVTFVSWILLQQFKKKSCGVATLYPDCCYNTHVWHWNNCLGSQDKMRPKLNYAFSVKKLFFAGPLKNLLLKETLYFPIWILLDTANMICLLIDLHMFSVYCTSTVMCVCVSVTSFLPQYVVQHIESHFYLLTGENIMP